MPCVATDHLQKDGLARPMEFKGRFAPCRKAECESPRLDEPKRSLCCAHITQGGTEAVTVTVTVTWFRT